MSPHSPPCVPRTSPEGLHLRNLFLGHDLPRGRLMHFSAGEVHPDKGGDPEANNLVTILRACVRGRARVRVCGRVCGWAREQVCGQLCGRVCVNVSDVDESNWLVAGGIGDSVSKLSTTV